MTGYRFMRRRGWWRGPLVALLFAAIALAGLLDRDQGQGPAGEDPGERLTARVIDVTDGDTVVVRLAGGETERVRYIGIDTPESDPREPIECYGLEAKRANAGFVAGREVELTVGAEARDDYGRLLAYVRVPQRGQAILVNAELVRRGFARTLTIEPNDALAPLFARLEAAAGRAGVGLWGACS